MRGSQILEHGVGFEPHVCACRRASRSQAAGFDLVAENAVRRSGRSARRARRARCRAVPVATLLSGSAPSGRLRLGRAVDEGRAWHSCRRRSKRIPKPAGIDAHLAIDGLDAATRAGASMRVTCHSAAWRRRREATSDAGRRKTRRMEDLHKFDLAQPQGVADHADRRQRHRRGSDDRRQQEPEHRIEHAGGNRHAGGIVDEGKEQVLPDVAHGRLRQRARLARCR